MEALNSLKDMRAEFERLQFVEDEIDTELEEILKEIGNSFFLAKNFNFFYCDAVFLAGSKLLYKI